MKKLFSLFAAVVCGLMLNAKTFYLNPGVWASDGAVFGMYGATSSGWDWFGDFMTSDNNGIYAGEVPDDATVVIFVRFNPEATTPDWDYKWNQTNDINIEDLGENNQYNITDWGSNYSTGEWSVYGGGDDPVTPPVITPEGDAYWYWKGYKDGEDINNEIDGGLFDCGISEIEVAQDAYIFVVYQVHGVPGVQYMAPSYVDGPTHATMTTSGSDKLHIPAGNYTLYLYDNGDGTVELAFAEMAGKTLVGCGAQGIENVPSDDKAHKAIIDGKLQIMVGNKLYDATGREL